MTENKEGCAVCGIPASQYCSACKSIKYCGAEHQKRHWKIHKVACRPFVISKTDDLGRFLEATRDIKSKSVILSEPPLVVGPKWYLNDQEKWSHIVPCVGCFSAVRVGVYSCPRCHWPACSPACGGLNNPKLHGLECPVLMLGPGPSHSEDIRSLIDYYRIDALIALKCLMLQKRFPKKWEELFELQSHEVERFGSELYQDAEKRIVSYLENNYIKRLQQLEKQSNETILPKKDAATLHRICGIIETNYMCINLPNGLELSGLYSTACFLEHSCQPNCYFSFDCNNGFKVSVIAGTNIKKGDHLKIMYSNMLWGTQMRQEHLQLTKHFICKCERCKDPTELRTFLSALRCMGEDLVSCGGYQLPQDPLDLSTVWVCNKCSVTISSDEVRYFTSQIGEEVDTLLGKNPTIEQLENLIEKLSQFLHDNHYHLFNLKHSLIQLYGKQSGYHLDQLSEKQMKKKLDLCEKLLEVCDKLDPDTIRLSLYVGIILYEKHSVLVKTATGMLNKERSDEEDSLMINNFKTARDCLLRAADILKKELDTVGGAKLSEAIIKALDNLVSNHDF